MVNFAQGSLGCCSHCCYCGYHQPWRFAPFLQSVAVPCAPRCRGAEGLWVPGGTSPPRGTPRVALPRWDPAGLGSGSGALAPLGLRQTHGRAPLLPPASKNSSGTAQEMAVPSAPVPAAHRPDRPPSLRLGAGIQAVPPPRDGRAGAWDPTAHSPPPSHPRGLSAWEDTRLSSLRTWNRHSLSQKSISAQQKSFGLEETPSHRKGMGFIPGIWQYCSPFLWPR